MTVPSSFFGINIATTGLMAQQMAMSVAGHNIANANNPTYKRQLAMMGAGPAFPYAGVDGGSGVGQLGTGARVYSIDRQRDRFIEGQLLNSRQNLGRWETAKQALDQVVGIIGEPSDSGLGSMLDKFWNSWQDLGLNPENLAVRSNVLEYGSAVAGGLNNLYTQIEAVRQQQDMTIVDKVSDINRLAGELAAVNDQIQRALGAGNQPNDLLDQRDAILSDLSRIVDIQVSGEGGATDLVTIGGHALVEGSRSNKVATVLDDSAHRAVVWEADSSEVLIRGGELAGIQDTQRKAIPRYLETLDEIANTLISRINELHRDGYGLDDAEGSSPQRDFFAGTGARDIRVSSELLSDPRKIAAAWSSGAPGDGTLAQEIAKLRSVPTVGTSTINEVYQNLVASNASDASSTAHRLDAQTALHQQLLFQQQSVSGVSLDEEMADMVRFQQAYNASARVFTAMDEMLDTLVSRVGVVGR